LFAANGLYRVLIRVRVIIGPEPNHISVIRFVLLFSDHVSDNRTIFDIAAASAAHEYL